jgi:hypothetical protein
LSTLNSAFQPWTIWHVMIKSPLLTQSLESLHSKCWSCICIDSNRVRNFEMLLPPRQSPKFCGYRANWLNCELLLLGLPLVSEGCQTEYSNF